MLRGHIYFSSGKIQESIEDYRVSVSIQHRFISHSVPDDSPSLIRRPYYVIQYSYVNLLLIMF